jgi:hypothetical protein
MDFDVASHKLEVKHVPTYIAEVDARVSRHVFHAEGVPWAELACYVKVILHGRPEPL